MTTSYAGGTDGLPICFALAAVRRVSTSNDGRMGYATRHLAASQRGCGIRCPEASEGDCVTRYLEAIQTDCVAASHRQNSPSACTAPFCDLASVPGTDSVEDSTECHRRSCLGGGVMKASLDWYSSTSTRRRSRTRSESAYDRYSDSLMLDDYRRCLPSVTYHSAVETSSGTGRSSRRAGPGVEAAAYCAEADHRGRHRRPCPSNRHSCPRRTSRSSLPRPRYVHHQPLNYA